MATEDDWSETLDDVFEGECDACGERRPVILCGDPYVAEIYPEDDNEESLWCRHCYELRAEDI